MPSGTRVTVTMLFCVTAGSFSSYNDIHTLDVIMGCLLLCRVQGYCSLTSQRSSAAAAAAVSPSRSFLNRINRLSQLPEGTATVNAQISVSAAAFCVI
jgi:hypothetical protein